MAKVPPPPPSFKSGASNGWLRTLSKSAPRLAVTRSVIRKFLCTPIFSPQRLGPIRTLRFATAGLLKKSDVTDGTVNACAFQIVAPLPLWPVEKLWLAMFGRKVGKLKSPTASMELDPTFPGKTGSQSSHSQKGVYPVPVLANIWNVVCQSREPMPPFSTAANRQVIDPISDETILGDKTIRGVISARTEDIVRYRPETRIGGVADRGLLV